MMVVFSSKTRKPCWVFFCLLLLSVGCTAVVAEAEIEVSPLMLSADEKLLHGMPLGERELALSYSGSCQKVKLRYERYAAGELVDSGETVATVTDNQGFLYVISKPEGNVVFFLQEGTPKKQDNGSVTTQSLLTVKVENSGLSSTFHSSLPGNVIKTTTGNQILLASVATDNNNTIQLYEPDQYADATKRTGYEELVLFSCMFE